MIIIATFIYIYLIKSRNFREAALVGIWAFVAIAKRQWEANFNIALVAIVSALTLFVAISIHGYLNRKYSIINKLKEE
jgi:uncharacterized membrane-anchored protein